MVLDRKLCLQDSAHLTEFVGIYVDHVKLSFGTATLIEPQLLQQKLEILRAGQVDVYPGGTLFELALSSGRSAQFFLKIKSLGFNMVEISDGTVAIDKKTRSDCIKMARDSGLRVVTEVGKKDPSVKVSALDLVETAQADLSDGAEFVIVEARESGLGVGIYDQDGNVREDYLDRFVEGIGDTGRLIWEAPQKSQQVFLINKFGPNVNIGNVAPEDVLGLESLRMGLRWDTRTLAGLK